MIRAIISYTKTKGMIIMKLREFNFNTIGVIGLIIIDEDNKKEYSGFIGEVLKMQDVINIADKEIKSTNYYFNQFVIRIYEKENKNNV